MSPWLGKRGGKIEKNGIGLFLKTRGFQLAGWKKLLAGQPLPEGGGVRVGWYAKASKNPNPARLGQNFEVTNPQTLKNAFLAIRPLFSRVIPALLDPPPSQGSAAQMGTVGWGWMAGPPLLVMGFPLTQHL